MAADYLFRPMLFLFFSLAGTAPPKWCTQIENPPNSDCPGGLVQSPPPLTCIDFTDTYDTWWLAYSNYCNYTAATTTILQVYKESWYDWLGSRNTRNRQYWIGLYNPQNDDIWKWSTGLVASKTNWAQGEPNRHKSIQRCAMLWKDHDGKWADSGCGDKEYVACHYPHPLGPTVPTLHVQFHRRPNILYHGVMVNITCTAFNAEGDHLDFTASDGRSLFAIPGAVVSTRHGIEKHPVYKRCASKTISMLTFAAEETMPLLFVSCFSRRGGDKDICPAYANPMAMCRGLLLKFVNGPKARPVAKYIYEGAPGPVIRGGVVNVNCTVFTGEKGKLTWVINFMSGSRVLAHDDYRIVYFRQMNDPKHGRTHISTIQFNMKPALTGISVSCFAHEVNSTHAMCLDSDLFCHKLDKLSVLPPQIFEDESSQWTKYLLYFLPLVFLIIVLAVPVAWICVRAPDEEGEDYDDDTIGARLRRWLLYRRRTTFSRRSTWASRRSTLASRRSTLAARRSTLASRRGTRTSRRGTNVDRRKSSNRRRGTMTSHSGTTPSSQELSTVETLSEKS